MLRKYFIILSLMLAGCPALSKTLHVPASRTIQIAGEVNGRMLGVISQIDRLSRDNSDPIFLLINSPGGSILVGNLLINAMNSAKARGVKFHCASTLLAASMAFQFFVECDHRYAMKYTKLLFHPPRIFFMGILLETQMREWVAELDHIETKMVAKIKSSLGMSDEEFNLHYHKETLWDAEDLAAAARSGFLTLVDDIKGLPEIFSLSPARSNYSNGQLIWIHPQFMTSKDVK